MSVEQKVELLRFDCPSCYNITHFINTDIPLNESREFECPHCHQKKQILIVSI